MAHRDLIAALRRMNAPNLARAIADPRSDALHRLARMFAVSVDAGAVLDALSRDPDGAGEAVGMVEADFVPDPGEARPSLAYRILSRFWRWVI